MKIKINKSKLINFGLLFLVLSIVFSSIPVDRLNALNLKEETTNPVTNAKSYMYYQAMRVCILNTNLSLSNNTIDGSFGKMSESDANSGKWFKNTTNPKIGYFANSYGLSTDNDQVGCAGDDAGWILDAVKIWGYNNPIEALCQFGMVRANGQDCYKGSGSLMLENPKNIALGMLRYEDFDKNIRTNVYGGSGPELTKAGEYEMYHSVFFTGCLGDKNKAEDSSAPDDDFTYNISVYNPSTKSVESKKYYGTKKHSEEISYSEEINTVTGTLNKTNPVKSTCENLAKKLNAESAGAYAEFDKANPGEIEKAKEESPGGESEDGETSCAIAGIGWILCPIVNFIAGIADQAFDFLSNHFLYINPKMLDTSSTTYSAWSVMRNLANVAFVIVFLIIIFSQISSFGITNYGIKKMLPRLIIAAILVNLSFYICQIVVDLSNILGYSMNNILTNIGNSAAGEDLNTAKASMSWWSVESGGFGGLMGKILATGGALAFLYLAVSLPVLIAAVFALTAILFILIARQAIVVILIAVAPLAFVAFLLPNTEKMFDKWRKTFTSMLILFPVISVVFGASSLAAKILSATFHGGSAGDTNGFIGQLIAAGAMVLPLFLVPGIIKKSIDGFGNLSAKMSGIGDSLGKKAGQSYKDSGINKYHEAKKLDRNSRIKSGNYVGMRYSPRTLTSKLNHSLNSGMMSGAYNAVTGGYGSQRDLLAQAQDKKDKQDTIAMFNNDDMLASTWAETGGDINSMKSLVASGAVNLSDGQQNQFIRMRQAGLHKKSVSHLAAAEFLSENGKSNANTVIKALKNAEKYGANKTDIGSAEQSAIAAYRKSGRGDALAAMKNYADDPSRTISTANISQTARAWNEVAPENINREAIATGSIGESGYINHLQNTTDGFENTRKALSGFDRMERRAQNLAMQHIIDSANIHSTSVGGNTITSITEAKDFFKVR